MLSAAFVIYPSHGVSSLCLEMGSACSCPGARRDAAALMLWEEKNHSFVNVALISLKASALPPYRCQHTQPRAPRTHPCPGRTCGTSWDLVQSPGTAREGRTPADIHYGWEQGTGCGMPSWPSTALCRGAGWGQLTPAPLRELC